VAVGALHQGGLQMSVRPTATMDHRYRRGADAGKLSKYTHVSTPAWSL